VSAQATEPLASGGWVDNVPPSGRLRLPDVRELIRFRELAFALALRDLQLRYKQTFFGVAWAVLQPLIGAVVFTLVFDRIAGLPSDGVPYVAFALAGLTAWTLFGNGTARATTSLVENEAFVTKVYFPRLLVPLAATLPGLVDLALTLVVLAVVLVVAGVTPGVAVLLLPVWIVLLAVFTFGTGSLFSAVNVSQIWLFASPVAYPSSLAGGDLGWLLYLNPMAGLLDAFRWSALGTSAPPPEALLSLGVGLAVVAAGIAYFGRTERRFADVI
jgi:lipopolysaccharide transport system permease protein